MSASMSERCGYCGHGLRLVAGFCVACHAPATVAQRARLVAAARRQRATTLAEHGDYAHYAAAAAVALAEARRPAPRWIWPLALVGLGALLLTALSVGSRIAGDAAPLALFSASSSLAASLTPDGPAQTTFHVGQTMIIAYMVRVADPRGDITLVFDPDHGASATFTEQRPQGDATRALTITPATPGVWRLALSLDHHILQTLTLTIQTS